jgi:hypothetical protein
MSWSEFIKEQTKNITNVYNTAAEKGKEFADKELKNENAVLRDRIRRAHVGLEACYVQATAQAVATPIKSVLTILEEK